MTTSIRPSILAAIEILLDCDVGPEIVDVGVSRFRWYETSKRGPRSP